MDFRYEKQKQKQGYTYIIGCDEVGRGSLAGPVVACATIFDCARLTTIDQDLLKQVKDSKLLTAQKREELSRIIKQHAVWSIGVVSQNIIDKINIHNATLLAMRKAVERLFINPSVPMNRNISPSLGENNIVIAIDGQFTIPDLDIEQEAIVGGDNKVLSIAAASIVAKVYRDNLMRDFHAQYPIYNFFQHKGYGTLFHRQMIIEHGLSPLHRLSFCQNLTV